MPDRYPERGKALQRAVKSAPLYQSDAALHRASGVTTQALWQWWKGTPPQPAHLEKVAEAIGLAPSELYAAWFGDPGGGGLNRIATAVERIADALWSRRLDGSE